MPTWRTLLHWLIASAAVLASAVGAIMASEYLVGLWKFNGWGEWVSTVAIAFGAFAAAVVFPVRFAGPSSPVWIGIALALMGVGMWGALVLALVSAVRRRRGRRANPATGS
jgi:hypothetical protein